MGYSGFGFRVSGFEMGATVAVGAGEDVVLVRRTVPVAMRAYLPHTNIPVTVKILFDTMYSSFSFRKSTPQQNRQLDTSIRTSKQ